jgi:hypothetical protein
MKNELTFDFIILFLWVCGKRIVAQHSPRVTQLLSENKCIAAAVRLKDRTRRQSLMRDTSATSSLKPSKFATYVTDFCKVFVSADITLFKIKNSEVRNVPLKYTQTDTFVALEKSLYKIAVKKR